MVTWQPSCSFVNRVGCWPFARGFAHGARIALDILQGRRLTVWTRRSRRHAPSEARDHFAGGTNHALLTNSFQPCAGHDALSLGPFTLGEGGTGRQQKLPAGIAPEAPPTNPNAAFVVLIAGSSPHKPGEHDYLAGCVVLMNLLRQILDVSSWSRRIDWPEKPETLEGAVAIVMLFDGGRQARPAQRGSARPDPRCLRTMGWGSSSCIWPPTIPRPRGRARNLVGGAWEPGPPAGALGRQVLDVPEHPIFRGGTCSRSTTATESSSPVALGNEASRSSSFRPSVPRIRRRRSDDGAIVSPLSERPEKGRAFTSAGGICTRACRRRVSSLPRQRHPLHGGGRDPAARARSVALDNRFDLNT